jgi:DNA invertase Pin-like site-specific DNA recombinase
MLLGYARVSTDQQDHALQLDALRQAGCTRVFVETASGTRTDRPELAKVLEQARQGDTLVIWRLDRLARSLRHLIDLSEDLTRRGVALKSITESIDTGSSSGRFMFNILGALGQMEREIIVERTRAGLVAAAARGRRGGRPPALDESKVRAAKAMLPDVGRCSASRRVRHDSDVSFPRRLILVSLRIHRCRTEPGAQTKGV